uniref:Secreted protein n=1 Tax=Physcomitrium patens TaxID=3218 RepID=A0A7I3Z122_PHYPA
MRVLLFLRRASLLGLYCSFCFVSQCALPAIAGNPSPAMPPWMDVCPCASFIHGPFGQRVPASQPPASCPNLPNRCLMSGTKKRVSKQLMQGYFLSMVCFKV